MYLSRFTSEVAQDRKSGRRGWRGMVGIAEAVTDQQFAPHTLQGHGLHLSLSPLSPSPTPGQAATSHFQLLGIEWLGSEIRFVAGYTNDILTALGNFCFLLPGSLSPVRLPRRIKSLDSLLKASDLDFVPLAPSPGS